MASITINGNTITVRGGGSMSIQTLGGRLLINGEDVTPGDAKQITIAITGDVTSLDVDVCSTLTVAGNVGTLRSGSGSVHVAQTVQEVNVSSGDVTCGDVGGNVKTSSGDVKCGQVAGSVKTSSGDIRHR